MSTVFSRRSFLKYTAVTAVAVAGTSLLGGLLWFWRRNSDPDHLSQ